MVWPKFPRHRLLQAAKSSEPAPQNFVDNASVDGSRLFGQGAEINVKKYNIINKPSLQLGLSVPRRHK